MVARAMKNESCTICGKTFVVSERVEMVGSLVYCAPNDPECSDRALKNKGVTRLRPQTGTLIAPARFLVR